MPNLPLRLLPLAIVVACSQPKLSPASPQDPAAREAVFLTAHDLAPGRHCRIVDAAVPLPDVAAVLDTAAIPEYLRQSGMAGDTGHAVFSLRYDSTGQATRERMIEYTVPDSLAESLRTVIASALLPRPAGSPLAARLRVDLGPAPRYRLGKSEYCEPEVIVVAAPAAPVDVAFIGRSTRPIGGPETASQYKYTVDVSAAGDALAVSFDSSVPANLVEGFRTHAMRQRWQPALDDGMPVAGRGRGSVGVTTRLEERVVPVPRPAP